MSVFSPGLGWADDYWTKYYTADEVEEILATVRHTMIPSSGVPLAVRAYLQQGPAPTIIVTQGLLPYGLMMCNIHLAFHRAGFNVVNADLPGFGLSGGPRGGPTIHQLIQMWRDLKALTRRELGDVTLFTAGMAEDSVTSYYAFANDPDITAMSLHLLLEYGDVENLYWWGSRPKIRALMLGARAAHALKLDIKWDAESALPWDDVVEPYVDVFRDDPLNIPHYTVALAATMAKPMKAPVPFEECRTPCQVIASENSRLWPPEHNRRAYERLGSPKKEFVLLEGAPYGALRKDFVDVFSGHMIRWFRENGAEVAAPTATESSTA